MTNNYKISGDAIKDNAFLLTLAAACLLFILFGEYMLFSRNNLLRSTNEIPQILDATKYPVVSTPKRNDFLSSPFTISGTVPPGWMFEGVFPIRLEDSDGNLIVLGVGRETNMGSWQLEEPIEFNSTLTFTTSAESGKLILAKEDPSGLLDTTEEYSIPVQFIRDDGLQLACTLEAKICPDGKTFVGRQGPKCEFAPCPN